MPCESVDRKRAMDGSEISTTWSAKRLRRRKNVICQPDPVVCELPATMEDSFRGMLITMGHQYARLTDRARDADRLEDTIASLQSSLNQEISSLQQEVACLQAALKSLLDKNGF